MWSLRCRKCAATMIVAHVRTDFNSSFTNVYRLASPAQMDATRDKAWQADATNSGVLTHMLCSPTNTMFASSTANAASIVAVFKLKSLKGIAACGRDRMLINVAWDVKNSTPAVTMVGLLKTLLHS